MYNGFITFKTFVNSHNVKRTYLQLLAYNISQYTVLSQNINNTLLKLNKVSSLPQMLFLFLFN